MTIRTPIPTMNRTALRAADIRMIVVFLVRLQFVAALVEPFNINPWLYTAKIGTRAYMVVAMLQGLRAQC